MVAGEPLGLFRVGRGGPTGSVGDRVGLCRGRPGPAAVPSADDDEDSGLCLLRGGIFLAPDPEASGGRRRFLGVGCGEPAGLPPIDTADRLGRSLMNRVGQIKSTKWARSE